GAADRDRAAPRRSRSPPDRAAAALEPDALPRSAHEAVDRSAARHAELEQPDHLRAHRGWPAAAQHRGPAEEPEALRHMAAPVITITRQYASGGSEVARLVAGALGWTVIDNEFVDQVAERAVERLGADPASVEQVVDETDRQRDQYVKTYYGRHRHDFVNYDLVVNTERLGLEGAAAVVVSEARRRGWK